jgi:hypothetical protein
VRSSSYPEASYCFDKAILFHAVRQWQSLISAHRQRASGAQEDYEGQFPASQQTMPVAAKAAMLAAAGLGKKDKAMIKVAEQMDPRGIVTDAVSAHHP